MFLVSYDVYHHNAVEMLQRAVIFQVLVTDLGFILFVLKVSPCVHHNTKTYGEIFLCILSLGAGWSPVDQLNIPVTFRVETGSAAHPPSYPEGNRVFSS
jgi:hypothetical protein